MSGRAGPGLRTKLAASYVAVVLLVGAIMLLTVQLTAPLFYREHVEQMQRSFGVLNIPRMRGELEGGFNRAFGSALVVAGLVAFPAALVVSTFVSRRIVRPVRRVSRASARIADGNYGERLPDLGSDELGELAASFNRMAAALEATEARRVELIGVVAHELRTPLAGIRGYAQGVLDGVFGVDRALPLVMRETRRLTRLVDDLSMLTRAESGVVPIHPTPVSLGPLARDALARLSPLFDARGIGLEIDERHPVTVLADEDRLVQVLTNLLSNALRHTPSGRVTVRVAERDGRGTLQVADTGEGIAPQDLPRVFERFYRADRSRARDADDESVGAGVGLTVSRHLVEAMGGELRVSSVLGEGATFTVFLPLSAPARA